MAELWEDFLMWRRRSPQVQFIFLLAVLALVAMKLYLER